ncbi:MAG: helix-turn-helix transcriptional regulator [Nocardioides sp.]|nr:helix-turn-helix transcriptional regulator [Nocardioides sp.]
MPTPIRDDELARAIALLGQKVRARREALGMSQEELGLRCQMDRKAIQNVEYGRSSTKKDGAYRPGNPKLDTIFTIAKVLDISVAYLVDPTRPVENQIR